jgi:hypothetical protein
VARNPEAGLKIDPETAEVMWTYAQTLDPYGVYRDVPEESTSVLGVNILPVLPEATYGSILVICLRRPATRCATSPLPCNSVGTVPVEPAS